MPTILTERSDTPVALVNVRDYKPVYTYTDEPFLYPEGYDGAGDIDRFRFLLERYMRIESARRNPMLTKTDAQGRPLYKLTRSGGLKRARELDKDTKRRVIKRDGGVCVWCQSTTRLEVDHIIRYADGGSNRMDNLRALCHSCHVSRGGRA